VKNFGATSLNEIRQKLGEHGLDLRTLDDEELAAAAVAVDTPEQVEVPADEG